MKKIISSFIAAIMALTIVSGVAMADEVQTTEQTSAATDQNITAAPEISATPETSAPEITATPEATAVAEITPPPTIKEGDFADVDSTHWAYSYIEEMTKRGVISGYDDGNFYPDKNVTRAEFARIMTGASGLIISAPAEKDFVDVEIDAWYAPYIHAAYPYLNGYRENGSLYYKPDMLALREDIAIALVKLKGYDTSNADVEGLSAKFIDVESISQEAKKYVATSVERGLVSGYDDGTFKGQSPITRAEATAMLWQAYQYGNDNKVINEPAATAQPQATPSPQATVAPSDTATYDKGSSEKVTKTDTSTTIKKDNDDDDDDDDDDDKDDDKDDDDDDDNDKDDDDDD